MLAGEEICDVSREEHQGSGLKCFGLWNSFIMPAGEHMVKIERSGRVSQICRLGRWTLSPLKFEKPSKLSQSLTSITSPEAADLIFAPQH
jgi:hypothetical protein